MAQSNDVLGFTGEAVRSGSSPKYGGVAALWALRILVRIGGYKRFSRRVMDEAGVFEGVGLKALIERDSLSTAQLKRFFTRRLAQLEQNPPNGLGALRNNLQLLVEPLSLSPADCSVLAFAVIIHNTSWLESAADSLGFLDRQAVIGSLATILKVPTNRVGQTFKPSSILATTGILRLNDNLGNLKVRLDLMDSFARELMLPHRNATELLCSFCNPAPTAKLSRSDYPHAAVEWSLISEYLSAAVRGKRVGVNILIHGRPGTWKTEFVRALSASLRAKLCEVASEDTDANALPPARRLGAYMLAQRALINSKRHVLLFDEIEDVFPAPGRQPGLPTQLREPVSKAWMNRMLEGNRVPCFWLSNHVNQIDRAYLRRFDLVVEMPSPTRSVRRELLTRHLRGVRVTERWLDRMAENNNLTPALIERAANVIHSLKCASPEAAERHVDYVVRGSLEAMGYSVTRKAGGSELVPYRLEYLNPDQDLSPIVGGLERRGQGRLCLYGPPGTGKTAFGKYVARRLDRPLLAKRASDLLSMWLGGTERAIAEMFREAERESAVLLLDEADSFLRDRAGAQRSWEVTQVNELLTQMESFEGVFIASTNLMDRLDTASLRRFDFKVKLGFLTAAQREAVFLNTLQSLGNAAKSLTEDVRENLRVLDSLVLGDFAVAAKQSDIQQVPLTQERFLTSLLAECSMKNKDAHRRIGFT